MRINRGYIALLTVILVSVTLLLFVASESKTGALIRFFVLQEEAKANTTLYAESCADQAILELKTNPSFAGAATMTFQGGSCYTAPISRTQTPIDLRVQGIAGTSYTILDVSLSASFARLSTHEIPNLWTP